MNDCIARALAKRNADAGTDITFETAWVHRTTQDFVTRQFYNSKFWVGVGGFENFENPGPDWVKVTRRVRTDVGAWAPAAG